MNEKLDAEFEHTRKMMYNMSQEIQQLMIEQHKELTELIKKQHNETIRMLNHWKDKTFENKYDELINKKRALKAYMKIYTNEIAYTPEQLARCIKHDPLEILYHLEKFAVADYLDTMASTNYFFLKNRCRKVRSDVLDVAVMSVTCLAKSAARNAPGESDNDEFVDKEISKFRCSR
jgi:hypothetical protein